jgi:pimeloyl-ACP methyl ester carboxylesterase
MSDATYALFDKEKELRVSDGAPIRYTRRGGDGLPVVLASGWSCSDAYWAEILPGLERTGHTVLLPDTRGHGESGLPRPPGRQARDLTVEDMSVERMARDLVEVCRAEGIERAVFAGHSMGVQTIFEVYREAPDLVAGLVPIAGPYENPLKSFYGQSFWEMLFPIGKIAVGFVPTALVAAWWRIGNRPDLGLKAAQLIGAAGPKVTKEGLAPYITHLSTRDIHVLFRGIEAMRRHSAADLLPSVDKPVVIVAGGRDRFTPPELAHHMHEVIPGSQLILIEEATHCLPIEEPDVVVNAITELAARVAEAVSRSA